MPKATPPTSSAVRRACLAVGLSAASLALTVGLAVPDAIADTVKDKQQRAAPAPRDPGG